MTSAVVPYQLLANAVLVLHAGIVLFVVGGLVLVVAGNRFRWRWVNHWWLRLAHLAAIAFVVVQTWLAQDCPLTTLESWLRVRAGGPTYQQGFIEHWLQRLIFYDAPLWVFGLVYTAFGALVLLAWWRYPPSRGRGKRSHAPCSRRGVRG